MAKITQYSRISHHTITGSASATFSVPTSEDFTDGTWTVADLALSEIGVNEDSKVAYIRIGNEVKEFSFNPGLVGPTGPAGPTGGSQSLSNTLAVGNTTGANNIIFNNNQAIYNGTNNAYVAFADELIEINSDISGATNSQIQVQPNQLYLESSDGVGLLGAVMSITMSGMSLDVSDSSYGSNNILQLTDNNTTIQYSDTNDNWFSGINIDGTAPSTVISTGYNSGTLLSRFTSAGGSLDGFVGNATASDAYISTTHQVGLFRVLKVDNDIEVSELKVGQVGSNKHVIGVNKTNFMYGTTSTTGFASASIVVLELPTTGEHCWVKVQVKAISSTFSSGYVADIFGGFRNDGSPNLIGTGYSVIEYTDFASGAQAYLDINSTQVRVRGLGQTGSTITWSANLTWG